MNKIKNFFLICLLCFTPMIVMASDGVNGSDFAIIVAVEAFISIHMSVFVLLPLSKLISPNDVKTMFIKLFGIRAIVLIIFDFIIPTLIAAIDFLLVFIGAFIIIPILSMKIRNKRLKEVTLMNIPMKQTNTSICPKCGTETNLNDLFCTNCGCSLSNVDNNSRVLNQNTKVTPQNFDNLYSLDEKEMLKEFVKREIVKANMPLDNKYIPRDMLKRKQILNIILSILIFIYIALIFFHLPIYIYIIGLIILVVYFVLSNRMDTNKYLIKQVKARPNEKISNIVMNSRDMLRPNSSKLTLLLGAVISIILSLIIFYKPHVIYEKQDNGYAIRFYTIGVTNMKTVNIPDNYKGEPIVAIRGNVFANMPFLKEVSLPDSIEEIRGKAFANNAQLEKINIPSHLTYLGGSAFYNCDSLTTISIPDSVTYIGGEAFADCESLTTVKLSNNIEEIRGNTFQDCYNLIKIDIPDKVKRIGGHAFHGCSSLSEVNITSQSQLEEIGSSAFRDCPKLLNVTLPIQTYVNYRAFKNSPTNIYRFEELENIDYFNN